MLWLVKSNVRSVDIAGCIVDLMACSPEAVFFCDHPDQKYINKFFEDNRLSSTPGFICYGVVGSDEMSLKTSPRWCPKKKGSV